ncbi:MAG: response regulator transcription factor [Kiritimatiellales bacterium]
MRTIGTQEFRQLSKICERVHGTSSNEPFTNHLYVILEKALPGIHFTIDHFKLNPLTLHRSMNQSLPRSTIDGFRHFIHQHPGLQIYLKNNRCVGSLLTVLGPDRYHKTELYNEVFRPVDVNDQVWLGVGDGHEIIAASYSRDTAYTESDLLTLSLIQPQIRIAWKNWQRTRALEAQLQNLKESQIQSEEQACATAAMKLALQSLTPRRREIIERIADGKSNQRIAEELKISRRTVEKHIEHIFAALNVNSRTALLYETGLKGHTTY